MLSELPFASYLTYDPRPTTEDEKEAKQLVLSAIKTDSRHKVNGGYSTSSEICAKSLRAHLDSTPFSDLFDTNPMLVPIPGSGKTRPGTLWVPERMVNAMQECGLGNVNACLKRVRAVQKSAFARPGQRPSAKDHFNSMQVDDGNIAERGKIVLVDDVITRGATMIASASRVAEAFPNAEVVGFAMVRVVGHKTKFKAFSDPVLGRITLNRFGDSDRTP